eukprot:Opistho-2@85986
MNLNGRRTGKPSLLCALRSLRASFARGIPLTIRRDVRPLLHLFCCRDRMNPICISPRRRALFTILFDWAMVGVLIGIFLIIEKTDPYHRVILRSEMEDYKYPLVNNTISPVVLMVLTFAVPAVSIIIMFCFSRSKKDLHMGLLGLCVAVLFTGITTDFVKVLVGRPRPDFFWRCFPDGIESWSDNQPMCTGSVADVREGRKSFPSGHSSLSFAGLGFLAFYIAGKAHVFDRRGHVYKMVLFMAPFFLALYVGLTRIRDYWHHWQDVTVGGLLGITIAFATYRQYFPALDHHECHKPHPYRDHFDSPVVHVTADTSEESLAKPNSSLRFEDV